MKRFHRSLPSRIVAVVLGMSITFGPAIASDTKGRVTGTIYAINAKPLANATVTMQSPAQTEHVLTDAQGHYAFLSLSPDTYTLTVHHDGYRDETRTDITVQADVVKDESLALSTQLSEIGRVTSRSRSSLVQPGITADVYSINTTQQEGAAALGGGNVRDSITSSLATVPGVFVPVGQQPGFGQSVFIRGGSYLQTGYEFDGVPVNRAFDQYSQSPLSSLGVQELQVYTGAAPIDQQTQGIGGYINQVVKSGTYPNSITASAGVGSPAFYNKASLEFSGANGPDKKFTYYIGAGGYGFTQRIFNQYNGGNLTSVYAPIAGYTPAACGPNNSGSCYDNGATSNYVGALPIQPNGYSTLPSLWGQSPQGNAVDLVSNFHFAIPHHRDNLRDDLQLLYTNSAYTSYPNTSLSAIGAANVQAYQPFYFDQNFYNGPLFTPLAGSELGNISNQYFQGNQGPGYYNPLAANQRDSQRNDFSIGKLAYRHNIDSNSNVRLTLYGTNSRENQNGSIGTFLPYAFGPFATDYSIKSNTFGFDAAYTKQFTAQHLLNFDLSQNTTKSLRLNNYVPAYGGTSPVALLVNGANPLGGCYGLDANGTPQLTDCASPDAASYGLPSVSDVGPGYELIPSNANNPTLQQAGSLNCGTGPCSYYSVSNGSNGNISAITSKFTSFSISDHFTPTKKLAIDAGLRYDRFQYNPANTNTPGNQLYANTYNQLNCISGTSLVANPTPGGPCSAVGPGFSATNLSAISTPLVFQEISPRLGAAYTLDANNVLRVSYGRFVQPAPAASQQSANTASFYTDPTQYAIYGLNSPTRNVVPQISINTDFSWEHQFKDNRTSFKATPFFRKTENEFATLVIDPKTNFLAFINGLNRTTSGLELAVRHGDFKKNGLSMMLAYTFTNSSAQFKQSPTGGSFVTTANQAIQNYNGFTSFCAGNPGSGLCPQAAAVAPAPCYAPAPIGSGAPGIPTNACGPGTIANPYWNSKPASLLDPNGKYPVYSQPLGQGAGGGSTSATQPNVASLIVNYKHNRWTLTPSFQYLAGARYGSPLASQGVDPSSCTAGLNSGLANDPRYSTGAPTGSAAAGAVPYDASSCSTVMAIPNPYTGSFDSIGEYKQPSLLTMNLQMSYEASKNATIQFTASNLIYRCFGGSKVPWSGGSAACNYAQASPYVGNVFNSDDPIQQVARYPYTPATSAAVQSNTSGPGLPTQLYLNVRFKM